MFLSSFLVWNGRLNLFDIKNTINWFVILYLIITGSMWCYKGYFRGIHMDLILWQPLKDCFLTRIDLKQLLNVGFYSCFNYCEVSRNKCCWWFILLITVKWLMCLSYPLRGFILKSLNWGGFLLCALVSSYSIPLINP